MQQHVTFPSEQNSALAQKLNPLVIVAASGIGADIVPFITLSQGLLKRGHRVAMLVPRFHEAIVLASGVPCQTFGSHDEWQVLLDTPDLWDERKGWGVAWNGLVPHLNAVRKIIQSLPADQPCVVLSQLIMVPMASLAKSIRPDLRIVCAYLAPSTLCSSHDMVSAGSLCIPSWTPTSWRQALLNLVHKLWINPVTLPSLNIARVQNRLPPVPHFFEHAKSSPDASLGLFPSWYAAVQPDWPQSFTEGDFVNTAVSGQTALSPELEQFMSAGAPPIVFTLGTGHLHASRYFHIASKVLKQLGRRGIFVTPHSAQLPDTLPPSVMWQAHSHFSSLLPRVAAVVHHGGISTIVEAFRSGTPQLIVPFAFDQFDNSFRAKRMGVADVLLAKRLSAKRMQKKLANLIDCYDVTEACYTVAQKMAKKPELSWLLDRAEAVLFEIDQKKPKKTLGHTITSPHWRLG